MTQEKKQALTLWEAAKSVGQSSMAGILSSLIWSKDPFATHEPPVGDARLYKATTSTAHQTEGAPRWEKTSGQELRVMTWNVKYSGGRIDFFYDGYGDRVLMRADEVLENLEKIAEVIRIVQPDVICLQEVDVASTRTALIDHVRWLLEHTHLSYAAYAAQWKADFIPSNGLGRVNSGVTVLSRFPIESAYRASLPLIEEQDSLTQYFFLRRSALHVTLALPEDRFPDVPQFGVLCAHTSAFTTQETKRAQYMWLRRWMDGFAQQGVPFVMGSDLNMVPPGATTRSGFDDVVQTDESFHSAYYEGQETWLSPFYEAYNPAVTLEEYARHEAKHLTHSMHKDYFWRRKLDYMFSNCTWASGSVKTLQDESSVGVETMSRSDHAPIVGTLSLGGEGQ